MDFFAEHILCEGVLHSFMHVFCAAFSHFLLAFLIIFHRHNFVFVRWGSPYDPFQLPLTPKKDIFAGGSKGCCIDTVSEHLSTYGWETSSIESLFQDTRKQGVSTPRPVLRRENEWLGEYWEKETASFFSQTCTRGRHERTLLGGSSHYTLYTNSKKMFWSY